MAESVFYRFIAAHYVAVAQAHFTAEGEAFPSGRRYLGKVSCLNEDILADRYKTLAKFGMVGMKIGLARKRAVEVGQADFKRIDHGHHARRAALQIVADRTLHDRHIHDIFALGHTDAP